MTLLILLGGVVLTAAPCREPGRSPSPEIRVVATGPVTDFGVAASVGLLAWTEGATQALRVRKPTGEITTLSEQIGTFEVGADGAVAYTTDGVLAVWHPLAPLTRAAVREVKALELAAAPRQGGARVGVLGRDGVLRGLRWSGELFEIAKDVEAFALAASGERAAVAGKDGVLRLVSLAGQRKEVSVGGPVWDFRFAARDDTLLYVVVRPDDKGSHLDLGVVRPDDTITHYEAREPYSMAPDGKSIAFVDRKGALVLVSSGAQQGNVEVAGEAGRVVDVAFSPTGRSVWFRELCRDNACNLVSVDLFPRPKARKRAGFCVAYDLAPSDPMLAAVLLREPGRSSATLALLYGDGKAVDVDDVEGGAVMFLDDSSVAYIADDPRSLRIARVSRPGQSMTR